MKVAVLTPDTNNTKAIYEPLAALGHDVAVSIYDRSPDHETLIRQVLQDAPQLVVYIGAIEGHHGRPIPKTADLARLGAVATLIHICFDGSEPAWWPQLESYYAHGNFALQVNIDGVRTGPIGERGLTTLCPIDPRPFALPPLWKQRSVLLGFGGYIGKGERADMIRTLRDRGLLHFRDRDSAPSEAYHQFLLSCRAMWNHPLRGSGYGAHAKARVLEAALAGCLVLERAGSPVEHWFTPDVDYLSYQTADDVQRLLSAIGTDPELYEAMAARLRSKVLAEHAPLQFWQRVFARLGFDDYVPYDQPPFAAWRGTVQPQIAEPVIPSPRVQKVLQLGPSVAAPQRPTPIPEVPTISPDPIVVDNDALHNVSMPPSLLWAYNGMNYVQYGPYIFEIPQSIGSVNIADETNRRHPRIRPVAKSLQEFQAMRAKLQKQLKKRVSSPAH